MICRYHPVPLRTSYVGPLFRPIELAIQQGMAQPTPIGHKHANLAVLRALVRGQHGHRAVYFIVGVATANWHPPITGDFQNAGTYVS